MSKINLTVLDDGTTEVTINDELTAKVLTVLNYKIENGKVSGVTSEQASGIAQIASRLSTDPEAVLKETRCSMVRYAIINCANILNEIDKKPELLSEIKEDQIFAYFGNLINNALAEFDNRWNATFGEDEEPDEEAEEEIVENADDIESGDDSCVIPIKQ